MNNLERASVWSDSAGSSTPKAAKLPPIFKPVSSGLPSIPANCIRITICSPIGIGDTPTRNLSTWLIVYSKLFI